MLASFALHAQSRTELKLKASVETDKTAVCLSEVIEAHNLAPREAEKLSRYCRIELKAARTKLHAQDIELHAWAAGILPDKIIGGPVTIKKATALQLPVSEKDAAHRLNPIRLKRGTPVQLLVKSEHMQIVREAMLLQDALTGEEVDVRPAGTRKTLRAKLLNHTLAELIQ